jgi:hypothetical protein
VTAASFIDHGPAHGSLSGDEEWNAAIASAIRSGNRDALATVFRARVQTAADGMLVVRSKGILPSMDLMVIESLLTGGSYEEVGGRPRFCVTLASRDDDHGLVTTVTDELQQALASADEARLVEVARAWEEATRLLVNGVPSGTEDSWSRQALANTHLLTVLAELARLAIARGEHMYCWVSV